MQFFSFSETFSDFENEILQRLSMRVGAKVFADSRGKSLQTLEVITIQTFGRKSVFSISMLNDCEIEEL